MTSLIHPVAVFFWKKFEAICTSAAMASTMNLMNMQAGYFLKGGDNTRRRLMRFLYLIICQLVTSTAF